MKKLGFGCGRLPLLDDKDQTAIDMEQLCRMADFFLGHGFTYFDTGYMYHEFRSETALREALVKRHPRDSFALADKLPVIFLTAAKDQERIFNEQLGKCGVEYFDVYLLHAITQNTYETAKRLDSFAFLKRMKSEGRARHIGLSFHDSAKLLEEILVSHPELEYVQLQINYLDWENDIIQSRKCYEVARKYGRKIVVMEPVKGGRLADVPKAAGEGLKAYRPDMSFASWAIRFAASLDGVETVLSGMSDYGQLEDNVSYMQEFCPLDEIEHSIVRRAADMMRKDIIIPCTGCHYCTVNCPEKIPVPEYFSLYNSVYRSSGAVGRVNGTESERIAYEHYFQRSGRASDCIGCKQCERICPQHINVTAWLKETARAFEWD